MTATCKQEQSEITPCPSKAHQASSTEETVIQFLHRCTILVLAVATLYLAHS